MTAIVWFYQDLRLDDHPALNAAHRDHDELIPVYILDEDNPWCAGGASRWWLHHSLVALKEAIEQRGGKLILRRSPTVATLLEIAEQSKADAIYFSRAYEPWVAQQQRDLHEQAAQKHIECKRFGGTLLLDPEQVRNQQGTPFKVFTPFYKHCLPVLDSIHPKSTRALEFARKKIASDKLSDWQLLPTRPNWAKGFTRHWEPGLSGAKTALQDAMDDIVDHYEEQRDLPARHGTSRLSPHLHFGELSPRQVWHQARQHQQQKRSQVEPYLRQLVWRDFSYYLLHHWPTMPEEPFRPDFKHFNWRHSAKDLGAWQGGMTGYPIVDAGMRELWQTGWMHNRVRMIVASFLTKHLRIHWLEGARWFWDTLVDADLANNTQGWQWVAGCGADAAPYFRIFNPILQGEKFDADGGYIRQWVPELAQLSNRHIHAPWQAPASALQHAKVELGRSYPLPIVDHKQARQAALDAYEPVKRAPKNK